MSINIYYEPRWLYDMKDPENSSWDLAYDVLSEDYPDSGEFPTYQEALNAGKDYCKQWRDGRMGNLIIAKITIEYHYIK